MTEALLSMNAIPVHNLRKETIDSPFYFGRCCGLKSARRSRAKTETAHFAASAGSNSRTFCLCAEAISAWPIFEK